MAIRRLDHVNFITHDMSATIAFYCDIIGLVVDEDLTIDPEKSVYFYIPGNTIPILHIGLAKSKKQQQTFSRFADLSETNNGAFSTGPFDHFCLLHDDADYTSIIEKFNNSNIEYQTYCHQDISLKQIWLLDPNGIRVELNFATDKEYLL